MVFHLCAGKNDGAVTLVEKLSGKIIIKYHCSVHRQVLCWKVLNFDHVMSVIISIISSIRSRRLKNSYLKILFFVNSGELPAHLRLEVIELQCSTVFQNKHRVTSIQDFYKSFDKEKFKNLQDCAVQISSIFESTYIHEQTFSVMNLIKTNND
ncbi:hypothetical protein PR048_014617 [Dryococelus australis]|uniref:Uncharacterized protein n=1 Tax=Dryococelus australis TaxID=614101 RepID=A0ABQ9HFI2_9NEOP|nr:hypothetical protein PR048_014617 [Dryococelus australis]